MAKYLLVQMQLQMEYRIILVSRGMVQPYQGTNTGGSMTRIGFGSSVNYSSSYFSEYDNNIEFNDYFLDFYTCHFNRAIDQLVMSSGIACQVLNDATLLVCFPFDADQTLLDYGYKHFHEFTANSQIMSDSRMKEVLLFNTSTSYFQFLCFSSLRIHFIFTIAFWVYPIANGTGRTLVHLSSLQKGTGSPYHDLLGLTPSGRIAMQFVFNMKTRNVFQGHVIKMNTWTHIVVTHNAVNAMR